VAGATAVAAYIDAKWQIRQDLKALSHIRWAEKGVQEAGSSICPTTHVSRYSEAKKRACLWYFFEDQAQRLTSDRCIWSRAAIFTWSETYDQACRYGTLLRSMGIQPRDLCAFYLQNSPEFMMALLGSWAVGSAPAMVNYNLSGDALVHCLRLANAKVLLVDEDEACRARVEEERHRIEEQLGMKIVILDMAKKEEVSSTPAVRPPDTLRELLDGEFPIFLLYTSGTTGMPKACRFPIARAWPFGGPMLTSLGLKPGPNGDTWYDCMPLYHGTGCCTALAALCSGISLAIGKKFSAAKFWDDVRDSGANAFVYVGETARYLLARPPSPRDRDHNVKVMYGNGMRPDVWKNFRDRFGIDTIMEFFNSTEGVFGLANPSRGDFTATAVGHHGGILRFRVRNYFIAVEPDYETGDLLRDPETGWVKRNTLEEGGEIIVAVPDENLFPGYHNNPEATAKKFVRNVFREGDLYFRSGDALRRDSEGRWFFLDRLGDTFRWKSENVSTAEVAEVIGRYPGVVEANVYGVLVPGHDGRAGCAAIFIDPQARQGFDFNDLLKHAQTVLPRYAVPVFLRIVEEMTPIHNNKQNKVPLRKEGVDPDAIIQGVAGQNDTLLWCPPPGSSYIPFGQKDWEGLQGGKARL
ncbi:acetyl-CoA synthetase-like protein, partial [Viridothelium virens]